MSWAGVVVQISIIVFSVTVVKIIGNVVASLALVWIILVVIVQVDGLLGIVNVRTGS